MSSRVPRMVVIGCGNPLRSDDGVGPRVVARLQAAGLPAGVRAVDAGTAGIDVVEYVRGVEVALVVDACVSDAPPGTIVERTGAEIEASPRDALASVHALRWDHALALARWRLGTSMPTHVWAILVEAGSTAPGVGLSAPVAAAADAVAADLLERLRAGAAAPAPATRAG